VLHNPTTARLIGTPEFRSGDGDVLPMTPKLAALVAYLDARHPAMVSRAELMDMFWERMFAQQARQNLRKAIGRLRRVLGDDVLVTNGDLVGLNTEHYESDTMALDRFLADSAGVVPDHLAGITTAELLSGIDIDGERWTDWLAAERQHRQGKVLRALTRAARACAEAGDARNADRFADSAARINPFAEAPRRIRMKLLAQAGRASEAIQEYRQFAALLSRDLDVEPSPETQDLMASISRTAEPAGGKNRSAAPQRRSLVVLPIRILGKTRRGADLAAGLETEIVTTLAKLSDLDIIDLSPLARAEQTGVPADQACYGAQTLLKCALQVVGDRVRLTAHLIDTGTNRPVLADRFDRRMADILKIQDTLTKDIVTQLQVRLTEGEQARVWSSGTSSFKAWEAIVRATHLIHAHQREGVREARRLAEGAVGIDPGFASAHAAIGWTHWVEGRWFWSDDQGASFQTALQLACKALALDPMNPDARTLHGVVLVHLGRYDAALGEMEQAVGLAPSHAHIAALAGYVHRYAGDPRRAIDLMDRAMRLSPGHPAWYLNTKAAALQATGETEQAEAALREALSRDPDFTMSLALLASLLGQSGRTAEAGDIVRSLLRREPEFSAKRWCAQNPYRHTERRELEKWGLLAAGAPP